MEVSGGLGRRGVQGWGGGVCWAGEEGVQGWGGGVCRAGEEGCAGLGRRVCRAGEEGIAPYVTLYVRVLACDSQTYMGALAM